MDEDVRGEGTEGDNDSEEESVPTNVKSYSDVIMSFEYVLKFLEGKGHTEEATTVRSLISSVISKLHTALASAKQSLITDYF